MPAPAFLPAGFARAWVRCRGCGWHGTGAACCVETYCRIDCPRCGEPVQKVLRDGPAWAEAEGPYSGGRSREN